MPKRVDKNLEDLRDLARDIDILLRDYHRLKEENEELKKTNVMLCAIINEYKRFIDEECQDVNKESLDISEYSSCLCPKCARDKEETNNE